MSRSYSSLLIAIGALVFTTVWVACAEEGDTPIEAEAGSANNEGGANAGGNGTAGISNPGGNGMGGTGLIPDGTENWSEESSAQGQMRAAVVYDEIYGVYAHVGDAIKWWNGVTWKTVTADQAGMRSAFHVIQPLGQGGGGGLGGQGGIGGQGGLGGQGGMPPAIDGEDVELAALAVNTMYRWNGLTWTAITDAAPGIEAAITYVTDDDIWAIVGSHIEWWDGLTWTTMTDDEPGIRPAMHYVSDTEIYAVVDEAISMWNGITWTDHTDPIAGLQPAITVKSGTEIYARIGKQVCVWDGAMWTPLTDEIDGMKNAIYARGAADIFAILSDNKVWRWASAGM